MRFLLGEIVGEEYRDNGGGLDGNQRESGSSLLFVSFIGLLYQFKIYYVHKTQLYEKIQDLSPISRDVLALKLTFSFLEKC